MVWFVASDELRLSSISCALVCWVPFWSTNVGGRGSRNVALAEILILRSRARYGR